MLHKSCAVRHCPFAGRKHNIAGLVGKTQSKNFGHERADLSRRKIDDRKNLSPYKPLGLVMLRNLRRAFLDADIRAEINHKLVGGFSGFRKTPGIDDCTHPDINFKKIIETA